MCALLLSTFSNKRYRSSCLELLSEILLKWRESTLMFWVWSSLSTISIALSSCLENPLCGLNQRTSRHSHVPLGSLNIWYLSLYLKRFSAVSIKWQAGTLMFLSALQKQTISIFMSGASLWDLNKMMSIAFLCAGVSPLFLQWEQPFPRVWQFFLGLNKISISNSYILGLVPKFYNVKTVSKHKDIPHMSGSFPGISTKWQEATVCSGLSSRVL